MGKYRRLASLFARGLSCRLRRTSRAPASLWKAKADYIAKHDNTRLIVGKPRMLQWRFAWADPNQSINQSVMDFQSGSSIYNTARSTKWAGVSRNGCSLLDSGAKMQYGVWEQSPPKAEAKCQISVQFLTFPCKLGTAELGRYLCYVHTYTIKKSEAAMGLERPSPAPSPLRVCHCVGLI